MFLLPQNKQPGRIKCCSGEQSQKGTSTLSNFTMKCARWLLQLNLSTKHTIIHLPHLSIVFKHSIINAITGYLIVYFNQYLKLKHLLMWRAPFYARVAPRKSDRNLWLPPHPRTLDPLVAEAAHVSSWEFRHIFHHWAWKDFTLSI